MVGFESGCDLGAEVVFGGEDVEGWAFVDLPVSEVGVFLDSISLPFEHVVVMPDIDKLGKAVFGSKSGVIFQGRFLGQ